MTQLKYLGTTVTNTNLIKEGIAKVFNLGNEALIPFSLKTFVLSSAFKT
jgi:hypothetical protein